MKFSNKKSSKIAEKKILRKVKKNWVIVSISVLSILGIGNVINNNVIASADSNIHIYEKTDDTGHSSSASSDNQSASNSKSSSSSADSSVSKSASSANSTDSSSSNSSSSTNSASSSNEKSASSANSTDSSSSNSSSSTNSASSSNEKSASSANSTDSSSSNSSSSTNNASSSSINYSSLIPAIIDSNKTTDSYSASDNTGIQNINDFDWAITRGQANSVDVSEAPSFTSKIDPMGAAWLPIIKQYISNGNYIVIPKEHIEQAENLFNDYIKKYNLSSNYLNFEKADFENGLYNIASLANDPIIQDDSGLKNVAPIEDSSYEYSASDSLRLYKLVVQTDFGNGLDTDGDTSEPYNSNDSIFTNHQSLEPYAGHYEAPIYQIVMQDLDHSVGTYNGNDIGEKNESGDGEDNTRQVTVAFPLDYMIYLGPQVYDKNGNKIVDNLADAPVVNIKFQNYYNNNAQVGEQKLFATPNSNIKASDLTLPLGFHLFDNNETVNVGDTEGDRTVEVAPDNNKDLSLDSSSSTSLSSSSDLISNVFSSSSNSSNVNIQPTLYSFSSDPNISAKPSNNIIVNGTVYNAPNPEAKLYIDPSINNDMSKEPAIEAALKKGLDKVISDIKKVSYQPIKSAEKYLGNTLTQNKKVSKYMKGLQGFIQKHNYLGKINKEIANIRDQTKNESLITIKADNPTLYKKLSILNDKKDSLNNELINVSKKLNDRYKNLQDHLSNMKHGKAIATFIEATYKLVTDFKQKDGDYTEDFGNTVLSINSLDTKYILKSSIISSVLSGIAKDELNDVIESLITPGSILSTAADFASDGVGAVISPIVKFGVDWGVDKAMDAAESMGGLAKKFVDGYKNIRDTITNYVSKNILQGSVDWFEQTTHINNIFMDIANKGTSLLPRFGVNAEEAEDNNTDDKTYKQRFL